MTPRPITILAFAIALIGLAAAGCKSGPSDSGPSSSPVRARAGDDDNLNPTAMRLHDLEGAVLEFYATHGGFPRQMEQLLESGFVPKEEWLVDPASNRRFNYIVDGPNIPNPECRGRVMIYQPVASASGRWVLTVEEIADKNQLITHVYRVTDAEFRAAFGSGK